MKTSASSDRKINVDAAAKASLPHSERNPSMLLPLTFCCDVPKITYGMVGFCRF